MSGGFTCDWHDVIADALTGPETWGGVKGLWR